MVAFIIFWSALFAILFFILGIVCKALAAGFEALMSSLATIIVIIGIALLVGVGLGLVGAIIDGLLTNGFWETTGMILLLIVEIGISIALIAGLGGWLVEIVAVIVMDVIDFIWNVLEKAAELCEKAYAKFLRSIIKQLGKC